MRVHSYVIEHDLGFAPNPFHRVCTLACCKPRIRKYAKLGELIIGTGATKPQKRGHLAYWMKVDEIITFDEYWERPEFRAKRPYMLGTRKQRYGDNIYHTNPATGQYDQEDSFHSELGGGMSVGNRGRDTGTTNRVLLGRDYAYWGGAGPKIPAALADFVVSGTGHKNHFDPERIAALEAWLTTLPERGYVAEPAHWQFLKDQS